MKRNGGPIALHQAGLWHLIDEGEKQAEEIDDSDDLF
jgi:hypothetical protein